MGDFYTATRKHEPIRIFYSNQNCNLTHKKMHEQFTNSSLLILRTLFAEGLLIKQRAFR